MKTSLLSCLFITISVFMFGQNTGVAKNLTNQGVKLNVASDLIYQGVKLHDAGKFDEAIIKYDEALEADKNNLTALYEKSYTLSTIGKNEDAIECCKLAVKHHPDDEDLDMIYVVWGNALDAIGEMNDAIEIYNEGIEKFPEFYLIYFNKGITYSSNKYYDKALSCFEEAITFNINHASSHNGIARLNQMDENYVPAVLAYTYFLIIEPEGSRAKLNIQEIENILAMYVEKTGKKSVSINIPDRLVEEKEPGTKDDFSQVELLMAMSSALDYDKKYKKESKPERFERKFDVIFSIMREIQDDNSGFYWDLYGQFFIDLQKAGFVNTLSYLVYASSEDEEIQEWLESHEDEINEFYTWYNKYEW